MTSMVASSIITKAYQDAQKLPRYGSLSADQLADGLDRLNDMINLWQTQGLKLFLESETIVTLVSGQQKYSFYPTGDVAMTKPLEVKDATYWDSGNSSRPLNSLSRQEWTELSARTIAGSVNSYFVEKLYDRINLYLWSVPDATAAAGTMHVILRNQASNPATTAASVLFPPEWAIALRWGLADELATGMPDSVQQRCQSRAVAYRAALEDWDVENVETYFQPDQRMVGQGSRFR